jgi:hypothetical protein
VSFLYTEPRWPDVPLRIRYRQPGLSMWAADGITTGGYPEGIREAVELLRELLPDETMRRLAELYDRLEAEADS